MVKAIFVKRTMGRKEWDTFYSRLPNYVKVGEEGYGMDKNVVAGFVSPDVGGGNNVHIIPRGCSLMNDEELRGYDDYCKSNYIYPRPFKDMELDDREYNRPKENYTENKNIF
jgi:hypothetical protein